MYHGRKFLSDESGAVSVDWVVLTAGIVAMALLFFVPILMSLGDTAGTIGVTISEYEAFLE
jgi:Flp pilus assembly pilin Flp